MRNYFFIALICLLPFFSMASGDAVTIGILPGGNPQVLEKESYILAEKLQQKIGKPVNIYISKNYSGMIEALKNKKIEFAFLTAMTYVVADEQAEIKVLLKKTWSNGPFYYSAIITSAKSKIKKISDLKGKTIAFVDEKSTSGYLYPQIELKKYKIDNKDFKNIVFSGNHAASVEMLETGKVDAVAVFSDDEKGKVGAWHRFAKAKNFKVRVLWMSEPIPNDPIVVRQDFYDQNAKLTHEIMYSLIEIQNDGNSQLSEILGTSDLMPATSRQYEPVREVVKSFKSVLKL